MVIKIQKHMVNLNRLDYHMIILIKNNFLTMKDTNLQIFNKKVNID